MQVDWLERLRLDPGTRTIGELFQERQWAMQEIARLRMRICQLEHFPKVRERSAEPTLATAGDRTLTPHRLLKIAEVAQIVGLGHASIYRYMSEKRFPGSVKVGFRSVRWRIEDVLAWRDDPKGWQ
jgi:prophage regulatory protein